MLPPVSFKMALNSSCCSALNIVTKWKLLKRLLQNNTVILFLFTDFHKNYFGHILVKNMNKIHVFFPRLGNTLSVLRADLVSCVSKCNVLQDLLPQCWFEAVVVMLVKFILINVLFLTVGCKLNDIYIR